jgi:hypothetical protein
VMAFCSSFNFLVAISCAYRVQTVLVTLGLHTPKYNENVGYFYGDSKTEIKLVRCDSCKILQICGGPHVVLVNLWVCFANNCPKIPTECHSPTTARQWVLL